MTFLVRSHSMNINVHNNKFTITEPNTGEIFYMKFSVPFTVSIILNTLNTNTTINIIPFNNINVTINNFNVYTDILYTFLSYILGTLHIYSFTFISYIFLYIK